MARRFPKVSEEELKKRFFNPSDLVNTKTTIPLRVGEERWIYIPRGFASRCISTNIHPPPPPSGDSCIVFFIFHTVKYKEYRILYGRFIT